MFPCKSVMIVNHRIIKEFKHGKSPRSYHFFCNSDQQPIQQQQQGQQQQQLEKPIVITLFNTIGERLRIESVWDEWYSCYTTHIVRDKNADAIVEHVLTQILPLGHSHLEPVIVSYFINCVNIPPIHHLNN